MRPTLLPLLALAACTSAGVPRSVPPSLSATSPAERPRPYPVFETRDFTRAVERGTRTRSGAPGARYWQQYARYRLEAELEPASRRITGRGQVRYENRSPDTLRLVAVRLYQNLYAPGAVRNEEVPVTGGMTLSRVVAQGQALARRAAPVSSRDEAPGWSLDGTTAWLRLPAPLAPGASADFDFAWSFVLPPDGAPREGTDGEVYYVAYWYPQIAVYDDVSGWQTDPYMGNAEFYMGYGDYDVALTVPEGWLVAATGALRNESDVLPAAQRERLARARRSGEIVHVVAEEERGAGRGTLRAPAGAGGRLTWRYSATNVRDFAWGASDRYLWDATRALAADSSSSGGGGDTVMIHSFYRPERRDWAWDRSAAYVRHSIEFLSRYLWPYPWPQMTAVDGVASCSGMEYPMMTCIGGRRDTLSLYSVTVHETAHMWFPMQVGSDEKRYAWQDEGLTRFNQAQAMREYFRGYDLETIARDQYLDLARAGREVELMRHGDLYPPGSPAYGIASYAKMATNMAALRALLGDTLFLRAYREYGRRWRGRHPQPYDFWNTFEDVAGRDLGWFWRTWWFETWTLDRAIAGVRQAGGEVEITVEDRGLAPMPARLTITRDDGSVQHVEVPVGVWLAGARRHTLHLGATPAIRRVELDAEHRFPEANRDDDVWVAAGATRTQGH